MAPSPRCPHPSPPRSASRMCRAHACSSRALRRIRRARCGRSTSITRRRPSSSTAGRRSGEANGCRARARSRSTARRVRCTRSTTRRRTPTWGLPRASSPRIWSTCTAARPRTRGCRIRAHRLLHESRHRRSRCQLRRFQRLRACLPRTAARAMGGRRRARMSRPPRRGSRPTGAADAARLTIAGGSAGGWTVLCGPRRDRRVHRGHLTLRRRRLRASWPPTRTTSRRATSTD